MAATREHGALNESGACVRNSLLGCNRKVRDSESEAGSVVQIAEILLHVYRLLNGASRISLLISKCSLELGFAKD